MSDRVGVVAGAGSPLGRAVAVRLAGAEVEVTLDFTPTVPTSSRHAMLEEAGEALDRAGRFLSARLAVVKGGTHPLSLG